MLLLTLANIPRKLKVGQLPECFTEQYELENAPRGTRLLQSGRGAPAAGARGRPGQDFEALNGQAGIESSTKCNFLSIVA